METAFRTDCGKVRPHNEDSGGVIANEQGEMLALVADGMGGHQAGDLASRMTYDFMREKWEKTEKFFTEESAEQWLRTTISEANRQLIDYAKTHPECRGMGTTLVCALLTERFVTVANIGDSRCYLLTEYGLQQFTDDHSLVGELVRRGQITEAEAAVHPRKHVLLRALGTEPRAEIEVRSIKNESIRMLLLCSDGLTNHVSDETMEEVLRTQASLTEKCEDLIKMANDAGGDDNITLALVDLRN